MKMARNTRTGMFITSLAGFFLLAGCGVAKQDLKDTAFETFTRIVCTNQDPELAEGVIGHAHVILKYNKSSRHITAGQLVNSEYSEPGKPAVAWPYNVDKVYEGTDYLKFSLKLGSDDDANTFSLDREDLTLKLTTPSGMLSHRYQFNCEIMDDSSFDKFLRDRKDRLNAIEAKNQI